MIEKINFKCLKGYYSVYANDICGDTAQDLLSNMVATINLLVDDVNNNNLIVENLVNWVKGEGLKQSVKEQLNIWIDNGTIDRIINQEIFADLEEQINKNKSDIVKVNNKIDDVKTEVYGKITEVNNTLLSKLEECKNELKSNIDNLKSFLVNNEIYVEMFGEFITDIGGKKDYTQPLKKALSLATHGSKIIFPNNKEIVISETIIIDKGVVIDFNKCNIVCNVEGGTVFDLKFTGENNPRIKLINYVFTTQIKVPAKYIVINGSINTVLQGDFFLTTAVHSQIHNYRGYGTKIVGEMRYNTSRRAIYLSSSSSEAHSFDIYVDVDITGQKQGCGIEAEGGTLDINGVIENCERGGFYFNGTHNLSACKLQLHCESNTEFDVKLGKPDKSSTIGNGQVTILNSYMIPSMAIQTSSILIGTNINLSVINSQGCFVKNVSETVSDCCVNIIGKGTYTDVDSSKNRTVNVISYGTSKFNEVIVDKVNIKDSLVQSSSDVLRFGAKGGMFQCKNDGGFLPEEPTTATVGGRWNSFKSVYAKELILFDSTGKPWKGTVSASGTLSFVSLE